MSNVIPIKSDTLHYIPNGKDKTWIGVFDNEGHVEFRNREGGNVVDVTASKTEGINKEKFKELCIAWLAMNFPEVIKFDD